IPGNHTEVQKLKRIFDTGKDYDLLARKDDIHPWDIATLLKLYLRELPERLMPDRMLEEIQALQTTDRQICHKLRRILIQLPAANYGVLSFLFHHLSKIAAHEETTKMTVWNMGTVFAPTLGIGQVLFTALMGGYHDVNGGNTSGSESASSSRSRSPSLSQNSSCASIQGSTGAAAAAAATVPVAVTIGDECISGEGRHNDDENLLLISRRSVAANATAIRSATMTAAEAAGYREKGMKIVWGGLMQDESVDYLLQDWTDPD
ncbi:Rho GTPase-activating protein 29, partial [Lunasporangiospora selenospora]